MEVWGQETFESFESKNVVTIIHLRENICKKTLYQMIFDIGIFGGGEESSSFTQERFTDHEGGRLLSQMFQFSSHLLTFSKYQIKGVSHTNSFLLGRFCSTISYSNFCYIKTKLILEKESDRGAIPNHKINNLILS